VDPEAQAVVNGDAVDDDFVVPSAATISFIKPPGQKGLGDLLTPAQVKRRWKLTESQYQELFKMGLPAIELDGEPRHPEVAVDEWFRSRFGRIVGAAPAPASMPLRPRERTVVQALAAAGKELKATAIARRANLPDNSNFRTMLANLVRRGVLKKGLEGYGLAPGVEPE
jgi:hypothetical protein